MATRLLTPAQYAAHQVKHGRTGIMRAAGKPAREALARRAEKLFDAQAEANATIKRRAKYGNVKTVVDGVKMDSKREAKRYRELGLLFKAGEIDFLARQVRFYLSNGITYIADFVYGETLPIGNKQAKFKITVEDAKGVRTPEFKIKAKLMKSEYGIDVVEV